MRTAEESSSTVLHRLIQEQLRYGNPTDTRTLLAIQQQALRGGGSGGGCTGSPRSSQESLSQEELPLLHVSARQEPQGQESAMRHLYELHSEQLPTYEEAKAHSLYLASQGEQPDDQLELKHGHVRSLSERLMQISLERNRTRADMAISSSHSYPQLSTHNVSPSAADERGPPPDYPFLLKSPGYMVSYSQEHGHYYREPAPAYHSHHHRLMQAQSLVTRHTALSTQSHNGVEVVMATHTTSSSSQSSQVEMLVEENERLKRELEKHNEKTAKLHKMELEIQRISEAYETLMKGSAKRETLEKTMRNKLESEIKRMHDFNRDLRDHLETARRQVAAREVDVADQNRQAFSRLLEQSEEREQLQKEVLRLRACVEALEQTLGSARRHNARLDEELRRKRAYVQKVERLQHALAQLQAACEKREQLEQRLRTRLERELRTLRAQQRQATGQVIATSTETSATSPLQQQLREKEEHILALEADITKWEQKYLEESTMRQFAMDAAATAAAQRDTTIINHSPNHSPNNSFNEELTAASVIHREMENRIRALHSQLLEKDAVIKVLQQRSHRDQKKTQQRALRPVASVPSISVSSQTGLHKDHQNKKGLSEDGTAAVCDSSCLTLLSQTCSLSSTPIASQATAASESDIAPASNVTEAPLNNLIMDMVEILI